MPSFTLLRRTLVACLVLGSVAALRAPVAAGETTLRNALPAGATLTIRTIAGFVHVSPATGDVVVRADAHADRGAPVTHVAETRSKDGWIVCEVPLDRNSCTDASKGERVDTNGSKVDLTVGLPPGVKLDVATVAGDVSITGVTQGVQAKSVSGHIKIATAGSARAKSVSGDLDVRVGSLPADTAFDSVSGKVALALPRAANADLFAQTLSGTISASEDVHFTGDRGFVGRNLRATLGRGGTRIDLHTVSGSIDVRTI